MEKHKDCDGKLEKRETIVMQFKCDKCGYFNEVVAEKEWEDAEETN